MVKKKQPINKEPYTPPRPNFLIKVGKKYYHRIQPIPYIFDLINYKKTIAYLKNIC
jgi:hypothetical protein